MLTQRFYISGPMTGLPLKNVAAFNLAAERLTDLGYDYVNPHDLPEIPHEGYDSGYHEMLRRDLKLLLDCDGLVVLPGWETSYGATREISLAASLELPIFRFSTFGEGFVLVDANILVDRKFTSLIPSYAWQ